MSVTSPEGSARPVREDFKTKAAFDRALKKWQADRKSGTDLRPGKPVPLKPDELDVSLLGEGPQFIQKLITDVPEIQEIFEEAAKKGWLDPGNTVGIANFKNAVMGSTWWESKSEPAIKAWALERTRKGEFDRQVERAKNEIRQMARETGSGAISEQRLTELARDWVYKGWDDERNRFELDEELAKGIDFQDVGGRRALVGAAGNVADDLRRVAQSNGLNFNDDYYLSAARSVQQGLRTLDDFQRDIREQAAGMWPSLSEQIRAGQNVRDLASGYINMIANEFEIDPMSVNLDDPYVVQALGAVGPDGKMQQMSLWDFRTKLRQDPRWMNTSRAQNEIASISEQVLKMFGMVG
jgi:hypothetical protein